MPALAFVKQQLLYHFILQVLGLPRQPGVASGYVDQAVQPAPWKQQRTGFHRRTLLAKCVAQTPKLFVLQAKKVQLLRLKNQRTQVSGSGFFMIASQNIDIAVVVHRSARSESVEVSVSSSSFLAVS